MDADPATKAIFNNKGEITPPYEQCWVMRSVGLLSLVRARPGAERCA
jgi:hypothetical protein